MNKQTILKAIEDEPEYPGELPENLKSILETAVVTNDLDLLTEALRVTVRLTKQGIKDRVLSLFKK